jgi:hypothetical protein
LERVKDLEWDLEKEKAKELVLQSELGKVKVKDLEWEKEKEFQ